MYKKITHHITEEHYAHPNAGQIKSSIEQLHGFGPKHDLTEPPMPPMPTLASPSANALYANSKKLWHDFLWVVRNSIVSAMDDMADQAAVATQLDKDLANMSNFVKPFYGDEFATQFTEHLKGLVTNLISIAKAIRTSKDITLMKGVNTKHINDIASLLNRTNPMGWPAPVVVERLTAATNAWIEQLITRGKKDYTSEMKQMTNAYNALLQSPTGAESSSYMHGLSDIFANGIMGQFPDKFKA
jgi:hypothetical protein